MANEILKTNDYSIFKNLVGNREIQKRADQICETIRKIGFRKQPILVNENMEIIDGQARFEALRRLNLPIQYVVEQGIGLEECRIMNSANKAWNRTDYIYSYASEGNMNYQRIIELSERFQVQDQQIVMMACGLDCHFKKIKEGKLVVDDEHYALAIKRLSVFKKYEPLLTKFGGKKKTFACAIFWLADCDIDHDYMVEKLTKFNPDEFYTNSTETVIESMQRAYNFKREKKNCIFVYEEYRKKTRGM